MLLIKKYNTVQNYYTVLSNLLKNNNLINRYIYALICYIDIERQFYSQRNINSNIKLNINMNSINKLFKKDTSSSKYIFNPPVN